MMFEKGNKIRPELLEGFRKSVNEPGKMILTKTYVVDEILPPQLISKANNRILQSRTKRVGRSRIQDAHFRSHKIGIMRKIVTPDGTISLSQKEKTILINSSLIKRITPDFVGLLAAKICDNRAIIIGAKKHELARKLAATAHNCTIDVRKDQKYKNCIIVEQTQKNSISFKHL